MARNRVLERKLNIKYRPHRDSVENYKKVLIERIKSETLPLFSIYEEIQKNMAKRIKKTFKKMALKTKFCFWR